MAWGTGGQEVGVMLGWTGQPMLLTYAVECMAEPAPRVQDIYEGKLDVSMNNVRGLGACVTHRVEASLRGVQRTSP